MIFSKSFLLLFGYRFFYFFFWLFWLFWSTPFNWKLNSAFFGLVETDVRPLRPQNTNKKIIKSDKTNTKIEKTLFFIYFWLLLELKITEIMKTSIFENLHSRSSESINFLICFMKISINFASKSLPKRTVSLYRVFHWFYFQNDAKMPPKMISDRVSYADCVFNVIFLTFSKFSVFIE